jgi:hypothetical protein
MHPQPLRRHRGPRSHPGCRLTIRCAAARDRSDHGDHADDSKGYCDAMGHVLLPSRVERTAIPPGSAGDAALPDQAPVDHAGDVLRAGGTRRAAATGSASIGVRTALRRGICNAGLLKAAVLATGVAVRIAILGTHDRANRIRATHEALSSGSYACGWPVGVGARVCAGIRYRGRGVAFLGGGELTRAAYAARAGGAASLRAAMRAASGGEGFLEVGHELRLRRDVDGRIWAAAHPVDNADAVRVGDARLVVARRVNVRAARRVAGASLGRWEQRHHADEGDRERQGPGHTAHKRKPRARRSRAILRGRLISECAGMCRTPTAASCPSPLRLTYRCTQAKARAAIESNRWSTGSFPNKGYVNGIRGPACSICSHAQRIAIEPSR